jgi:DNA helicase-2/ATP-dependent DNA helicase PcrA
MAIELILGPPGTGKTTALLDIVDEELKKGTRPYRIGFVSFTRAAADVAASRAMERFGLERTDLPWFRTIHSLAYRVLGLHPDEILAGKQIREFSRFAGIELTGRWADDGSMYGYKTGDRILHMENLARVRCEPLRNIYNEEPDDLPWSEVERVSRFLSAYKNERGLTDYTDMLLHVPQTSNPPVLDVLLVDELQDQSEAQWRVLDWLRQGVRRVVLAGDDDQALFVWAGANVKRMLELDASVRVLGQSYRVPHKVQAVAANIIEKVGKRRPKKWAARAEEGFVERFTSLVDADLENGKWLVLARNNFLIENTVIPELYRRGIYFSWKNKGPVSETTLNIIRNWEKLRAGGSCLVEDVLPIYASMSNGRGYRRGNRELAMWRNRTTPVTLDDLKSKAGLLVDSIWHEALDRLPHTEVTYIIAARKRGERTVGTPRVRLSTIHGAKGDEADNVLLLTECAARTAKEAQRFPDDEARCWYVGVTRARQRLTIVDSYTPYRYAI